MHHHVVTSGLGACSDLLGDTEGVLEVVAEGACKVLIAAQGCKQAWADHIEG